MPQLACEVLQAFLNGNYLELQSFSKSSIAHTFSHSFSVGFCGVKVFQKEIEFYLFIYMFLDYFNILILKKLCIKIH